MECQGAAAAQSVLGKLPRKLITARSHTGVTPITDCLPEFCQLSGAALPEVVRLCR